MIPFENLSLAGRATMRLIGIPASEGCSLKQIARETKISLASIEDALEDLRLELLTLATRTRVLERLEQLALPPL
jgi:hypothetical protein